MPIPHTSAEITKPTAQPEVQRPLLSFRLQLGLHTALCSVTDIPKVHFAGMSLRVPTPVGSITDMVWPTWS